MLVEPIYSLLILFGVALAAIGGALATVAASRTLAAAQAVARRVENAERRLLCTQLHLVTESVLSEAFFVDQVVSVLKQNMIEDAINAGEYTSKPFKSRIEVVERRKAGITAIQQEARRYSEQTSKCNEEKLLRRLVRAEAQLVKLRQAKKYFEKKLAAYRDGEPFFGDDTIQ